jgi:hypothetical protein
MKPKTALKLVRMTRDRISKLFVIPEEYAVSGATIKLSYSSNSFVEHWEVIGVIGYATVGSPVYNGDLLIHECIKDTNDRK